jgi:radical SAM superfamily enzyme YgiQ (UPF0313 family)
MLTLSTWFDNLIGESEKSGGPMNTLLVYPKNPETFWSFKHSLKFISKKAVHPPLGLITVAAMLPDTWNLRLVDLNITSLSEADLEWSDMVFLSAMSVQRKSVEDILDRAKTAGVTVVAGGPLFTSSPETFDSVDHLILNEAELTLPDFLRDLENGSALKVYRSNKFADLETTPAPRWDLLDMKQYVSMNIQFSRGCPYDCEFCDITVLYGRRVRVKRTQQLLKEMESLYATGWRGDIFFVDDNFIGNRKYLERDVLPAMIRWMQIRRRPFNLSTEVSIDIADHRNLMTLMIQAGFSSVFIGIESPDDACLTECGKRQNRNRDLEACINQIQKTGLRVRGGFIVGFDSDTMFTFERLINFIQNTGIVTAMVGLLNAPRGTRLYHRLIKEGRFLSEMTGDNTDFSINFIPQMKMETLIQGYQSIISRIYSPRPYYERVKRCLKDYRPEFKVKFRLHWGHIQFHSGYAWAFLRSVFVLGIKDSARWYYWKLLLWSIFRKPSCFASAVTFSIYGYHFRRVFAEYL